MPVAGCKLPAASCPLQVLLLLLGCRVASCANSVALSHRAFPFGFLSLPPLLCLPISPPCLSSSTLFFFPLLSSSLFRSPSRQLITYFPKINMHCKLRCKTHLRAALPTATSAATATSTALRCICGYRTAHRVDSSGNANVSSLALALLSLIDRFVCTLHCGCSRCVSYR